MYFFSIVRKNKITENLELNSSPVQVWFFPSVSEEIAEFYCILIRSWFFFFFLTSLSFFTSLVSSLKPFYVLYDFSNWFACVGDLCQGLWFFCTATLTSCRKTCKNVYLELHCWVGCWKYLPGLWGRGTLLRWLVLMPGEINFSPVPLWISAASLATSLDRCSSPYSRSGSPAC